MGRETDAVAFFSALAEAPYQYDFYQTLRRLECLYHEKPRWGQALRPVDEPVRLGQDPDLDQGFPEPSHPLRTDGALVAVVLGNRGEDLQRAHAYMLHHAHHVALNNRSVVPFVKVAAFESTK